MLKKEHICSCGRKSMGFKQCVSCRQKKYQQNTQDRKNKQAEKDDNSDLDSYFEFHIDFIKKNECSCMECGVKLSNPDRWNVCHILPKKIFKSVRSLLENSIYLCRTHHQEFDNTWERASKMKVWAIAVQKVKSFIFVVKEKHKILNHFN